tara:strand:+ start:898 stop:1371 length:474 start_codon:yes stop_codon:yes gene_type:complete
MNPKGYNLSSITHHGIPMATVPEWRWISIAGAIMVLQSLLDIAPEGPWDARSFTRGVIGLIGLCCLYVGWFRFTFKQPGIIPSINRWQNPEKSWKLVVFSALVCFLLVFIINNTELKELLPETSGMIILLIGCLAMMNGVYVGLVVSGPLNEDLEQE